MGFITTETTKLATIDKTGTLWPIVEHSSNQHFYLCNYTTNLDYNKSTTTISTFDHKYLLQIQNDPNLSIECIQLIYPKKLDNSKSWGLCEVKDIHVAKRMSNNIKHPIYKIIDILGQEIICKSDNTSDNQNELIFEHLLSV